MSKLFAIDMPRDETYAAAGRVLERAELSGAAAAPGPSPAVVTLLRHARDAAVASRARRDASMRAATDASATALGAALRAAEAEAEAAASMTRDWLAASPPMSYKPQV
jgi:hypothetical protein